MDLEIPGNIVGLRLCKVERSGALILCKPVMFERRATGVRRALLMSSAPGPIGETGDFWADLITENGDWTDTVALNRESWNRLKNHLLRCKIDN